MARGQRIIEVLTDDLDQTPVESTDDLFRCFFGIQGTVYQLDLSRKNLNALRNSLKKYITAAEKADTDNPGTNVKTEAFYDDRGFTSLIGIKSSTPANTMRSERAEWLQRVREWARSNGHQVSDKGRLGQSIVAAYERANPNDTDPS